MSRIGRCFAELKRAGRKALIPYITAGDPDPDTTVAIMHSLVEAGADIVELGIPFSDPMADGPVIQAACERALAQGVGLEDVLASVGEFRKGDESTPVVLMGYLNPVETMGHEAFADAAQTAGVDGVLLVDLALEEAAEVSNLLAGHGIDLVLLIAPTSSEARIRKIAEHASGYIYYVSLKGVTGAQNLEVGSLVDRLGLIRRSSQVPIAVGFGIRDADSAAAVAGFADGVVVGSALVSKIATHGSQRDTLLSELNHSLSAMRAAMDAGNPQTEVA